MRISARADYAVRAVVLLARWGKDDALSADTIARECDIPGKFLEAIMTNLRRAGIVMSQRGAGGGFRLALAADDLSVADVIRAVEGPLVYVRDARPSEMEYADNADAAVMVDLWVALRAGVRAVLETTTIQDLAIRRLPAPVQALVDDAASWQQSSAFGD